MSVPTWYDEFELPDGSFFVADIYDYLEYLIKKHETLTSNSPVKIYVNKIKNCIVLKWRCGIHLFFNHNKQ